MSYRVCFISQLPFSILLTILAVILPESPAWLLREGRDDAGVRAMTRLRGRKMNEAQAALKRLRDAIESESQGSHIEKESYLSCFKQPQLRRTLIVALAEFVPLLFGLQLLGSASYFLQQIGMESSTSVLLQVVGIGIGTLASCVTFYTLSRFGRRKMLLMGLTAISIIWCGVGFSGIWQNAGAMW